ncbi:MAG: Gfo/Idh/MocA family protein [Thermomicrobiales bacterium]
MIEYRFEAERVVRAGFVGCGGHSYRNVYPTFRYAPVDLVAVADVVEERAVAYAREFGARRAYGDYREMLDKEELDCVFVVTNYDERGRPRFPGIAMDAMRAGCHAWIEKPPAADLAEVEAMMAVERETGRFVQVGYKKMFTPTIEKAREISRRPEFGGVSQMTVRYPQRFPPMETRFDLAHNPTAVGLLDHIFHPLSVIQFLGGDATSLTYQWDERAGGVFALLGLRDGGVACLHAVGGPGCNAPLERVEVVGQGAHLVIENGIKLTYYRPGTPLPYGRAASFVVPDDEAPLHWEPEFSLGVLSNDNAFLLGYVPEVRAFCQRVLEHTPPERASLRDTWMMMQIYEAFREPAGRTMELRPAPVVAAV